MPARGRSRVTAAQVANPYRIHALEALRASLMILGVVAHALLILPFWFPKLSRSEAQFAASIYNAIHVFRLPVYFVIAGFFAAWLYSRDGLRGFVVSRFKRLTSVLIVAQVAIAATFALVGCTVCEVAGGGGWWANAWLYLWFLYYLVLISHGFVLVIWLAQTLAPRASALVTAAVARLKFGPATTVVGAILTALVPGIFNRDHVLILGEGLLPNGGLFAVYAIYFGLGWLVFIGGAWGAFRANLVWNSTIACAFAMAIALLPPQATSGLVGQIMGSGLGWFATATVIGLAFAVGNRPSRILRYLDDASYWVYLWHAIPMLAAAALLARVRIAPFWFVALCVVSSLIFSLGTYQLIVRNSIIGLWLSGRRRPTRRLTA